MPKASFTASDVLITPANFFVAAIYDNSAPTVLVEAFQIPKMGGIYTPPFQWTFATNLISGHGYTLKLWESPDDTPTGIVRNSTTFVANITTTLVRLPDYITVDVTPGWVADATSVTDTTLVGWDYALYRNQVNMLFPEGYPNVTTPDYRQEVTGGITLLGAGITLQPGEQYVIIYVPQVANIVQTVSFIQSGQILTGDITLDNTYVDQELYIQGSGTNLTITLPNLATIGDYKTLQFNSRGGNHISAIINTYGSDTVQSKTLLQQLVLCQDEDLILYKANGVWNIRGTYQRKYTGEIVYKYRTNEFPYVFADGSEFNRKDYAGLFNHLSILPSSSVISEASWNNTSDGHYINRGYWTFGNGSTTFRAPLLYNNFLKLADGSTRTAGSFELLTVGSGITDFNDTGIYALIRI